MFAKLASDPSFKDRVRRFFALAPQVNKIEFIYINFNVFRVANVKNIKGLLKFLADFIYPYFPQLFDILGDGEFLPNNWFMKEVSKWVCGVSQKSAIN
jgi:hypothetical protein